MANKKTSLTLPPTKPRNPVLVPALQRRAGAHGKTRKALRQQMRQRTRQSLGALLRGDQTEGDIN